MYPIPILTLQFCKCVHAEFCGHLLIALTLSSVGFSYNQNHEEVMLDAFHTLCWDLELAVFWILRYLPGNLLTQHFGGGKRKRTEIQKAEVKANKRAFPSGQAV